MAQKNNIYSDVAAIVDPRPIVLSAPSDDAFCKSLNTMVGNLVMLTRVLSAKQYSYDEEKSAYTIGLNVVDLQDKSFVPDVTKDSPAEKEGIVKGSRLMKNEGRR